MEPLKALNRVGVEVAGHIGAHAEEHFDGFLDEVLLVERGGQLVQCAAAHFDEVVGNQRKLQHDAKKTKSENKK